MAITTTLTPFPNPAPNIQSQSQEEFSANADSAFTHLMQEFPEFNNFASEANATADQVNTDATTATTQAGIATTKAGEADTSAANALASEQNAGTSEANALASEQAALASLNDFKGRWYGALASDPATDPLGNPVDVGDAYFNSTTNKTLVYNGANWMVATANASDVGYDATGTDSTATNANAGITESLTRVASAESRITTLENPDFRYDPSVAWVVWDSVSDMYQGVAHPIDCHLNMRRCTFLNGAVNYYLDANDSDFKEDGVTASVLTGEDGDVMVEIPPVYTRIEHSGSQMSIAVSATPRTGFTLHPAFADGTTHVYVGAYHASVYDVSASAHIDGLNLDNNTSRVDVNNDLLASVSGRYPMVGLTRAHFRDLASRKGASYQQLDYWIWNLLQTLFVTEYGNWNSQAVVGEGNVNRSYLVSSSNQADSPHVVAGVSNLLGNVTGTAVTPDPYVSYRGIENLWGNAWLWCDGFNILDRQAYLSNDPSGFADDTATGYTMSGAPMPEASATYIRSYQPLDQAFLPASVSGGSSSTFVPDGLWTATGWRVALVCGLAISGSLAGLGALSGGNLSSYLRRNVSARLCARKKAV